jgi:hypothetical protein
MLTFPLIRRGVFQRHCFMDGNSFGFLRLMSQLLDHGAILRVPYPIYRHADSAQRLELEATEPWYQEFLRSDWEFYLASMGATPIELVSTIVAMQTMHVYLSGQTHAREKGLPLLERGYMIRNLAYSAHGDPDAARARISEWERTRLIAAVTAHIRERLTLAGSVRRIVAERGTMNLDDMLAPLAAPQPGFDIVMVDMQALLLWDAQDGDFMIAEHWDTLQARAATRPADPARELAVADVIASLRLPGSAGDRLLRGPTGSYHMLAT